MKPLSTTGKVALYIVVGVCCAVFVYAIITKLLSLAAFALLIAAIVVIVTTGLRKYKTGSESYRDIETPLMLTESRRAYHHDPNMREDTWGSALRTAFPDAFRHELLSELMEHARASTHVTYPIDAADVPDAGVQVAAAEIVDRLRIALDDPDYGIHRVAAKLAYAETPKGSGTFKRKTKQIPQVSPDGTVVDEDDAPSDDDGTVLMLLEACIHAPGKSRGGCLWAHVRYAPTETDKLVILSVGSMGIEPEDAIIDGPAPLTDHLSSYAMV